MHFFESVFYVYMKSFIKLVQQLVNCLNEETKHKHNKYRIEHTENVNKETTFHAVFSE